MKRKSSQEYLPYLGLAGHRRVRLATIAPLGATSTATATEAIVIEDTTDILLRDMSEYRLNNMLTSFGNADPLSEVIGGGTESAQEVQADGGIDHRLLDMVSRQF